MEPAHSALYLTDARDSWWNLDFLQLVARRFHLESAQSVLDVGCGQGHWTAALAQVLPERAHLTGVDREPRWTEMATARFNSPRFQFQTADATALPFDDGSFDVVTCQTLLIHVSEPDIVLREMLRVVRPGGLVLCAEPNNVATNLASLITGPNVNLDDLLAFVELEYTCERGKHALRRGFNSVGETLAPRLLALGAQGLQVYVNDRANRYDAQEAAVQLAERQRLRNAQAIIWPLEETLEYFISGGGSKVRFNELWMRAERIWYGDADTESLLTTGAGLLYLVGARRAA